MPYDHCGSLKHLSAILFILFLTAAYCSFEYIAGSYILNLWKQCVKNTKQNVISGQKKIKKKIRGSEPTLIGPKSWK